MTTLIIAFLAFHFFIAFLGCWFLKDKLTGYFDLYFSKKTFFLLLFLWELSLICFIMILIFLIFGNTILRKIVKKVKIYENDCYGRIVQKDEGSHYCETCNELAYPVFGKSWHIIGPRHFLCYSKEFKEYQKTFWGRIWSTIFLFYEYLSPGLLSNQKIVSSNNELTKLLRMIISTF